MFFLWKFFNENQYFALIFLYILPPTTRSFIWGRGGGQFWRDHLLWNLKQYYKLSALPKLFPLLILTGLFVTPQSTQNVTFSINFSELFIPLLSFAKLAFFNIKNAVNPVILIVSMRKPLFLVYYVQLHTTHPLRAGFTKLKLILD